jgi:hypothetical protein
MVRWEYCTLRWELTNHHRHLWTKQNLLQLLSLPLLLLLLLHLLLSDLLVESEIPLKSGRPGSTRSLAALVLGRSRPMLGLRRSRMKTRRMISWM